MLIPVWAEKFLNNMAKLRKIAGQQDIYDYDNASLPVLLRTGKGNCVATSKLFRKILKKLRVTYQHIGLGEYDAAKDSHQITIVYQNENSIWLQSNDKLLEFNSLSNLIKYAETEMGWKDLGMKVLESEWVEFK